MDLIKSGQIVKLTFKAEQTPSEEFVCLVNSVDKESLHLIPTSEILSFKSYLEEGDELTVRIYTPAGIIIFDSIILSSPIDSDFIVEYVEEHQNIQRREYIRGEYAVKMLIERSDGSRYVAQSVDVGGGGIKFISDRALRPGEKITGIIYIPEPMPSIRLQGLVLKQDHLPQNQYVVMFTAINESDREKLIKLCFKAHHQTIQS